ncbi:MAG: dihydrodipicolinate synthase family protein [Prolixibacteraceae bacterium]
MVITENIKNLKGIVPPLITPLLSADELDVEGLQRLIEHILKGGVSGLFVLGTTGEFSSLSYRLRREMVERTCKQVAGRVPVLVGITDTSIVESIDLANYARDCGADALVAAPPYYYGAAQPELIEYFESLARKVPLPLYLYNMPVHTKVMIDPATVRKIAEIPSVVGLKDSSANMAYFRLLQFAMRDYPEFQLFVGPEEMMADAVVLGADGGVNGGANMFPKLYVDLYNAAAARDFDKIKELQGKVLEISTLIYTVGRYGSSYLKGLKCALSVMGICDDYLVDPFHRFRKDERERIVQNMEKLDWRNLK